MSIDITKTIFFVGGCKGGVGKTFVSLALIDYLQDKNYLVNAIETDNTNPEILKIFKNCPDSRVPVRQYDLTAANGWVDLVNFISTIDNDPIVINTAAGNNGSVDSYGGILEEALEDLNKKLVTLWVINRQKDSLGLLLLFMKIFSNFNNTSIYIVRNNYFGNAEQFELYNNSKLRKDFEAKGWATIDFPDVADRVADDIYSNSISIKQALAKMPIGNRAELKRWRNVYSAAFSCIF
jgi:hypothetical protein